MTPKTPTSGPVVAVSNLKGGTGKTVLAVHLAYIMGATLLDLDPQGDAVDWCRRSGLVTGHHVHGQEEVHHLLKILKGPVVLDSPPGENENLRLALAFADVAVIPVKAGSSDLRALGRMQVLIKAAREVNPGLRGAIVLNEAKSVSTLSRDMETALEGLKGMTYLGHLGDRVAIPEAIANGEVVGGSSAADEVMAIADSLSTLLKGKR